MGAITALICIHIHIHVDIHGIEPGTRGLAGSRACRRVHAIECLVPHYIILIHSGFVGTGRQRMAGWPEGRRRLSPGLEESQQRLLSRVHGFGGGQHRVCVHDFVTGVHRCGHLLLLLLCREDPAERFLWSQLVLWSVWMGPI